MFESIFGQNDTRFELGSAAQPPFTKLLSVSTQNASLSFQNLAQNHKTGFITPAYIGLGQPRDINEIKPQKPLDGKSLWHLEPKNNSSTKMNKKKF